VDKLNWDRVKQVFQQALGRPDHERHAYVREQCGGDDALQAEVESLLSAHAQAGSFGERPAQELINELDDGHLPTSPERALQPGDGFGPYQIDSFIGAGGMGEVYLARDGRLGRAVAIKVLPSSFAADRERLARFEREARVLAALNNPHVATLYGVEDVNSATVLVLELVAGETLAERIARGPIPPREAILLAIQLCDALGAAHESGIVHRDLKPANIKITADGVVKVLDFGLAKVGGGTSTDLSRSPTVTLSGAHDGVLLGTVGYMSPEQARGQVVDQRADIWAFGCVLYEMLTGKAAFSGDTVSDSIAAILEREPDWTGLPTTLPVALQRLLRRCLEKDVKRRLHDIADARIELEDALTEPTASPNVPSVGLHNPKRIAWSIAGGLVVALVATVATWTAMRRTPEVRPLIRLNVDLGPDVVADVDSLPTVAISPDGRRVVFPIRIATGASQLATRSLDQALPTALPGTENGGWPFFSPDSQWIAFVSDGKLKKISVQGGPVFTICDAPNPRGGSWGEDGTIVAQLNANNALYRVPATGGTPQPLTTLVNGELTHRFPQILPDGQSVLFTASTDFSRYRDATLQVVSLKTGRITTVLRGGSFGRYFSGYLIYLHEGVLFGVPFDLTRLSVRGTPVVLLEDVATDPIFGGGEIDLSRTGSVVYRPEWIPKEYRVMWLDATGRAEPLLLNPGVYMTPRASPDGQSLALALDAGKGPDLYVYNIVRNTLSRLTFNSKDNRNPVWTPDGRHLVYASTTDKAIMWIRADGAGEPQRLLTSSNVLIPWSFSPDGRYLSYSDGSDARKDDSWILSLDMRDPEHPKPGTPEIFLKTPAAESGTMFSPDGHWLSYLSSESGPGFHTEVYVRPFHGSSDGKWQISTNGGTYSFWSRDGHLFYLNDNRIMVVEYTASGESFSAGKPRIWSETLVRGGVLDFPMLDLAPDGKRFVVFPKPVVPQEKGSFHVTFLLNFVDELQRRLP
jgi:serine/threonine-protein kinase